MSRASTELEANRTMLKAAVENRKLTAEQMRDMLLMALDNMGNYEMDHMTFSALNMHLDEFYL